MEELGHKKSTKTNQFIENTVLQLTHRSWLFFTAVEKLHDYEPRRNVHFEIQACRGVAISTETSIPGVRLHLPS